MLFFKLDRVHSDDRGGTQLAGEIKGQQLSLESIEISNLVPVTRDINLVEVSTESEDVNNLSVIRENRPQHKNSVTEEVENMSVIRDNRPQHKYSATQEVENVSVIRRQ
jgi:hypothetical protein